MWPPLSFSHHTSYDDRDAVFDGMSLLVENLESDGVASLGVPCRGDGERRGIDRPPIPYRESQGFRRSWPLEGVAWGSKRVVFC